MRHIIFLMALLASTLLSGCGGIRVAGLSPEYPPLEKKTFSLFTHFVPVDSLQPVLRWRSFPKPDFPHPERVQNVTYELRIWDGSASAANKLEYARNGLALPEHRLEKPLEPATRYLWSVRARFTLGGTRRVTEWGMAGLTLRNHTVPNPSCFRFETPPDTDPQADPHQVGR